MNKDFTNLRNNAHDHDGINIYMHLGGIVGVSCVDGEHIFGVNVKGKYWLNETYFRGYKHFMESIKYLEAQKGKINE